MHPTLNVGTAVVKDIRMELVNKWYSEKVSDEILAIINKVEVNEKYQVHTGGRTIFGELSLVAEPSDKFSFKNQVTWPDEKFSEMYDKMILHGLLDVLFGHTEKPILGMSIVLKEIGWDEIDSCPIGYYHAAKKAAHKILHPEKDVWNFE